MAMGWKYSNGYSTKEFSTVMEFSDDYTLTEEQKDLYLLATATAASKTLTLGLEDGQPMTVINNGATNAFTLKNLDGDDGVSVAPGDKVEVIGSTTVNGTKISTGADALPSVTSDDNGKVLTVSSGEWSAENPVSYDKTFIYNLSIDEGTGDFVITLDAASPIPAVEDFDHPERNRVQLVLPANLVPGIGYIGLFLPFTMEVSISIDRDQLNYTYSATGALSSALANFAIIFSLSEAGVTATFDMTTGD